MTSARWCRPPTMAMLQVAAVTLAAGACSEPAALRAGEAAGRAVAASSTDNASRPGEPVAEPCTFHSLGVRWPVRGDANADAASRRGNRRCRSSGPISGGGARRPVPAARGYLRRGHLDDRPPRNGRAVDHLPRCGRRRDDPRWWRARAARERQRGAARLARGSDPAPRQLPLRRALRLALRRPTMPARGGGPRHHRHQRRIRRVARFRNHRQRLPGADAVAPRPGHRGGQRRDHHRGGTRGGLQPDEQPGRRRPRDPVRRALGERHLQQRHRGLHRRRHRGRLRRHQRAHLPQPHHQRVLGHQRPAEQRRAPLPLFTMCSTRPSSCTTTPPAC